VLKERGDYEGARASFEGVLAIHPWRENVVSHLHECRLKEEEEEEEEEK